MPIGSAIGNAAISFDTMTASALAVITDRRVDGHPVIGYAFDSIGRYAKGTLARERFIPRLLAAAPDSLLDSASGLIDPERCWRVAMTNEKPAGHGERSGAVGLIDAALWDARAKAERMPLWRVLAERYRTPAASGELPVYGSCGHFKPGESLQSLTDEVRRCRDAGFETVKIKVGASDASADLARIDAALRALDDSRRLAVDANGMLEGATGDAWIASIGARRLAWIEEPAAPLDFSTLARQALTCPTPLATGENLFSLDEARNLMRYGGLRIERDRLQFDVSFCYGIPEYARIISMFESAGWPRRAFYPHAGHLLAAHVVAGFALGAHEVAPDASLAYGGLWDGVSVANGRARIPDVTGVGFEYKANMHALLAPLGK